MRGILTTLFLFCILWVTAQVPSEYPTVSKDSTDRELFFFLGDSTVTDFELETVRVMGKRKFETVDERIEYVILRRKTRKVWPYASMAAERLEKLTARLDSIPGKRAKKKYAKKIQKFIEEELSAELKRLTRTEGQILIKLIHRQTGSTTYELLQELRSGWNAWWWQRAAGVVDISLKEQYDPMINHQDFLIEDILQRSFSEGIIEEQEPAIAIDYDAAVAKWDTPKTKKSQPQ